MDDEFSGAGGLPEAVAGVFINPFYLNTQIILEPYIVLTEEYYRVENYMRKI